MERLQFTINNNGKKTVCETIATYHDDDTNKDYIIYTDKTFDENKKLRVYYGLYEKVGNGIKLFEAKTTEEKKMGLQLIKEIIEEIGNQS